MARILIIDDEDELRFLLRQMLEDAGHDVSDKTDRDLMTTQMVANDFAKGRMQVYASPVVTERSKAVMHLFK